MAQTILIIDDEKAIRKALNEILTFEGFKIDEAADGAAHARAPRRARGKPAQATARRASALIHKPNCVTDRVH